MLLLSPLSRREYPGRLKVTLLWHPFQLWLFDYLDHRIVRTPSNWINQLDDPSLLKDPSSIWHWRRQCLMEFAANDRYHSFLRLLALMLRVEPYVHPMIDPMARLPAADDGREYFIWRDAQPCAEALTDAGMTIEEAEKWHSEFSRRAQWIDPLESFRKLMRHADRTQRKRLKGAALLAHDLYDHAEVLRRYLEKYHDRELLEEDDVGHGPGIARINEENFGSPRPGDFDRRVFRRIARHFGVDPQAQTVLFVEGDTEEGSS